MKDEDLKGLAAREAVIINKDKSKSRACKYNQIRVHKICTHISNGNTFRASALAEGISEAKLVNKLTQSEDWRAAAWILERRFPESWTKKEQIDMHVSRSEGLDEIKAMIEQTDHLLNVERPDANTDS